jgi:tRNA (guanosine-2'-O-)-methyltransferase
VRKTALGTDRFLTITQVDKAVDAVDAAHAAGFRVVAVELAEGAQPLHVLKLVDAVCLVVGNEDHGIGPAALKASDDIAFLPQLGKVGSLNVATAASIALYEARRQEWSAQ